MYIATRYESEISLRHFQTQAAAMAAADKDGTTSYTQPLAVSL